LATAVPRHASRETKLAKEYPIHVVTAWLGNTPRIAMKHDLQVMTDADFERASQSDAQMAHNTAQNTAQNAAQQAHAGGRNDSREMTQPPGKSGGYAIVCEDRREGARSSSGEDRNL
jgi:hypothetical protein